MRDCQKISFIPLRDIHQKRSGSTFTILERLNFKSVKIKITKNIFNPMSNQQWSGDKNMQLVICSAFNLPIEDLACISVGVQVLQPFRGLHQEIT